MVGDPLVAHSGEQDYNVLNMPGYRQPQHASECIYYTLWIATNYVANSYPDKSVRDATNPPKLDLIKQYIDTGDIGWEKPKQDPLTELAREISSVKLNLQCRYGGHPQDLDEFVQDGLENLLPTIIWIDKVLLKQGDRGTGPLHAVVVSGVGDSHITIEDPLVEGTTTFEIDNLEEAWDPEYNTAIEVSLSNTFEPTRREEL